VNPLSSPLIINADDFGLSTDVSGAILSAFQEDLISTTSLMVNMPGFEEACKLARAGKLEKRVGLHLNLSEGRPLTSAILDLPRFCRDGLFRGRPRAFRLSAAEARAVEEELEAQMQACLQQGIRPIHLDSHHHVHTEWAPATIVIGLARRHSIPRIRLSRNVGPGLGHLKRVYKAILNRRLRRVGLGGYRYFGSVRDVAPVLSSLWGGVEIMVHPRWGSDGRLRDYEEGPELRLLLADLGISAVETPS
jgi:predicted glycoside hydrolase/deacetylase ChbG (UPF0249 family)